MAEQHAQQAGHDAGHHDAGHHVNYKKIYLTLLALLVVSVVGPFLGNIWITLITAFGIAIVKARPPLQVAEKPEPPPPPGNNSDSRAYRPGRDTREEVIAAVRELMGLGPDDPTPLPPPRPDAAPQSDDDASETDDAASASQKPDAVARGGGNQQGAQ
jgi:hypothetical protein